MLEAKNLSLVYPDGKNDKIILNNLNLKFNQGENVILLGPSGCGKSSLIYLLSTLRRPTKGTIYLNEQNISSPKNKINPDIRKNHFAFIFQMHFLIPYLNVLDNVLSASNSRGVKAREQAIKILKELKMGEHINKSIHQLSGGERQRVAIARALVSDPDIIFADEPTASLDHLTACEVLEILKNHKKEAILIMATHDTSILKGDERIINILGGKATEKI